MIYLSRYQTFYNVKRLLEEKGFIRSEKRNRLDHDITIVGNVFASMEEMKQRKSMQL